ncbi:unnamed protein product [Clonostachys rhizophaga]|uniref:Uncharacterized protein n=1 Tax=Clonostachys rhizophaga TaxID=160324 RepID=A0A9N9YFJ9_9HYPO|nr:unnamed protein product [Clonostachys rhizophaga]
MNILLGETQHRESRLRKCIRWFKIKVRESNHPKPEEVLLDKVRMEMMIRLFLRKRFFWFDAELTRMRQTDHILPRSDKRDLNEVDAESTTRWTSLLSWVSHIAASPQLTRLLPARSGRTSMK